MLKHLSELNQHFYHKIDLSKYIPDNFSNLNLVLPGDIITKEQVLHFIQGYIHGHGTYEENGVIYSSLVGTVQRTNKLLTVNPIKAKYNPSVGDIVIGTVQEIANKRWRVDIQSENESYLHLNSTYLPEQRKKTEEDELNMRLLFKEGDVICAEVHSINNDKTINLHTRSIKYGQLRQGTLIKVNSKLIKRQKHHFCKLTNSPVHIIMSHNGNIWISDIDRNQVINDQQEIQKQNPESFQTRQAVARSRNLIKLLNQESVEITLEIIEVMYDQSKQFYPMYFDNYSDILNYNKNECIMKIIQDKIEQKIPQEINKLQKQGVQLAF